MFENQERYEQLIGDLEAELQWKRIEQLLGNELFCLLENCVIELFIRTVNAENDAEKWKTVATRYIVNEVKENRK